MFAWGCRQHGENFDMGVPVLDEESTLTLDCGVGCTTLNILTPTELYILYVWYVNSASTKLGFTDSSPPTPRYIIDT